MFLLNSGYGIVRAFDENRELTPGDYHSGSEVIIFLTDDNKLYVSFITSNNVIKFQLLDFRVWKQCSKVIKCIEIHQHSLMYIIKDQLDRDDWLEFACCDPELLTHYDNIEELDNDFWIQLERNTSEYNYYKLNKYNFNTYILKAQLETC